jgi:ribonuclease J
MEVLQITPIGGLGEVGKNMLVLEYGRNLLIVDAGIMFPESDMLGVDYIIPDYRFLRGRESQVRGIVITHGHEDHIGALPYLLQEFNAPVYATKLTRGLIEVKLREGHLLSQVTLHTFAPGDSVRVGPFTVEPYHVCHSIPDAVGLGIETPLGLVVHSGDFKLDHTPVDGWPTDFARLAEFSGRGVLALFSDSTNADHPGTTPSERTLTTALGDVFRQARGRVIVGTFASLISRIQQVIEVATSFGRKVAIAGTTMVENVKMAQRLGYLNIPEGAVLPLEELNRLPPHQAAIVTTGAQGEPNSILGRLATGRHPSLRIVPGDTVILSSHTIPGNEEYVHRVINRLFQRGANVFYDPVAPVHVSGHASQEEQKMLLNILRPRFFVPIHGELRHLKHHANLAQQVGIPRENIAVVENGHVLRFTQDRMEVGERVPGGYVFVDGPWVGDAIGPTVIHERETLAQAGVCAITFQYDARQHGLLGEPRIVLRGFAAPDAVEKLIPQAREIVKHTVQVAKLGTAPQTIEEAVEKAVGDFFYREAKNRPTFIVVATPEN